MMVLGHGQDLELENILMTRLVDTSQSQVLKNKQFKKFTLITKMFASLN